VSAQKVFAARLEGRDLEKRDARKRMVADRVEDLLEAYITQHVSQNRAARATSQMLRRELSSWSGRSIHEISKRDVIEIVSAVEQRGAPVAANKTLKAIKTFLRWCVGRAVLDQSPAEGIPLPTKEVARDRVLNDDELARVIIAARQIGGPYGGIVELLALTGQRREEAARCVWDEFDLHNRLWTLPNLIRTRATQHKQESAAVKLVPRQGTWLPSSSHDTPHKGIEACRYRYSAIPLPASHLDRGLSSREIAPSTARQVIKVAKNRG
jgi:integrase